MRTSTIVLSLLCIALAVACLYLFYATIDQAITIDYSRQEQRYLESDRAVVRDLARDLLKGTKRERVDALLASKYAADHLIKEDDPGELSVDNVILRFRGDELEDIVFVNESAPERPTEPPR